MKCSEILTFDDRIHDFKSQLDALGLMVLHPKDTTILPGKYRQQVLIQEPPEGS